MNFERCAGLLSQLSTKAFGGAAETLNIQQSTLSRGLRDLEHQLGAILFERTNGGTRPTLAGEEFLDAARRIIKKAEAIAARVKMRSRGESGRLTIGVHASLSAGNLRATLIEHRRRFPEVHTHLVDGSSNDLISKLANSDIDVAFVVGGPGRNFSSFSLAKSSAPSHVAFFAMTWRLIGFSPLSEPAGVSISRWIIGTINFTGSETACPVVRLSVSA